MNNSLTMFSLWSRVTLKLDQMENQRSKFTRKQAIQKANVQSYFVMKLLRNAF